MVDFNRICHLAFLVLASLEDVTASNWVMVGQILDTSGPCCRCPAMAVLFLKIMLPPSMSHNDIVPMQLNTIENAGLSLDRDVRLVESAAV